MKRVVLTAAFAMALLQVRPSGPASQRTSTRARKQKAPNVAEFDSRRPRSRKTRKLQEQMDKIRSDARPAGRQNCSRSMRRPCQNNMGLMQGMWGSSMMGCCGNPRPRMDSGSRHDGVAWHG